MKDLTEGNVLKNILSYSWPMILGDTLQSLYGAIDAFWVGRLIGPDALAAVSASQPVLFMLLALLIGTSIATVIMAGQAYGNRDTDRLSLILVNSFMTVSALCAFLSVTGLLFSGPALKALNTPAEILADAKIFINVIFAGMFFMFIYNWFAGILRGLGDSKTPLIFLSITITLNILLAPLFIKGFAFIPAMGIAGSALATVVSYFITSIISVIYLAKKNPVYNIIRWKYKPDFAIIGRMLAIGMPMSLQMLIAATSGIVLVSIVNRFGHVITAVFGIGIRIDQFSFTPAMSLGSAASAFTAQYLGAGKQEKIREMIGKVTFVSVLFAMVFVILVNLFPRQIASIFTSDAEILSKAPLYLHIASLTYIPYCIMFIYQGVIRGSGDTLPSTVFAVISLLLFRAGTAYVLALHTDMREAGIWTGMALSVFIGMSLNFFYYRSGLWLRKFSGNNTAS